MTDHLEASGCCEVCERPTRIRTRSVNHVVHLLASIFLCGTWLWVWGLLCLTWSPNWFCTRCGAPCDGPPNRFARVVGSLALATALVILLVGGGFLFSGALATGLTGATP